LVGIVVRGWFYTIAKRYPALQSGYAMSPRGIGAFVTTFIVGRLVERIRSRWLLCFGFTMLAVSSYMLSDITLQVSPARVILPSILKGVAISFIFVPLTTVTMSQLNQRQHWHRIRPL
jgi:DHA2 family multidrug resistance protein